MTKNDKNYKPFGVYSRGLIGGETTSIAVFHWSPHPRSNRGKLKKEVIFRIKGYVSQVEVMKKCAEFMVNKLNGIGEEKASLILSKIAKSYSLPYDDNDGTAFVDSINNHIKAHFGL